jgi:hypothetical protein
VSKLRYEVEVEGAWVDGVPAYKWRLRRREPGNSGNGKLYGDAKIADTFEEALSEGTDKAHAWESRRKHEGFKQTVTVLEIESDQPEGLSTDELEAMFVEADQA